MARQLVFSSAKEQALYKIEEAHRLFAEHLERTKGKKLRLLRLFIYDAIATDQRPNCYQVKLDPESKQPVQFSRPHAEFKKKALEQQTYDQSLTTPGIYYYVNLKYWGSQNFSYHKDNEGYFLLEEDGSTKRILKSEVVARLQEWEKNNPDQPAT